jgi:hypothetical protein
MFIIEMITRSPSKRLNHGINLIKKNWSTKKKQNGGQNQDGRKAAIFLTYGCHRDGQHPCANINKKYIENNNKIERSRVPSTPNSAKLK